MTTFLPDIPSDNIYKFISFAGLFLAVFFIVYPYTTRQEVRFEKIETSYRLDVLSIKKRTLDVEYEEYKDRIREFDSRTPKDEKELDESMDEILKNSWDPKWRDQQRFLKEFFPSFFNSGYYNLNYFAIPNQLDSTEKRLNNKKIELELLEKEQEKERDILAAKEMELEFLQNVQSLGITIGLLLFTTGLLLWYTKIQKVVDENLKSSKKSS